MVELPNGCVRSEITVYPENWEFQGDLVKITCYLQYRFRDPRFNKIHPQGKFFVYKQGINTAQTFTAKKAAIKKAVKTLSQKLAGGYNPITRIITAPKHRDAPDPVPTPTINSGPTAADILAQNNVVITPELLKISKMMAIGMEKIALQADKELKTEGIIKVQILLPGTPFVESLWAAYKKLKGVPNHLTSIRGAIRGVTRAAFLLGLLKTPISEITKRHIRLCLEVCKELNPKWSNELHNRYKWHLQALFRELSGEDAVATNIIKEINTEIESESIRPVLKDYELAIIDDYLHKNHYYFWRMVRIFFHSGSRETELMQISVDDVDLEKREYLAWIYKGKRHKQVPRPISKNSYHLWVEVIRECKQLAGKLGIDPGKVILFGKFLKPGLYTIRPDQFGKRWREIVKRKLGINKDLYSLKHLHSDQIAALLGLDHAQVQDAHDSPETTRIYTVGEDQRKLERLKKVDIPFVPRRNLPSGGE